MAAFVAIFFSKRWIIPTILAVLGVIVLARLGIWQLDRLDQRRSFNQEVFTQIEAEQLDLNDDIPVNIDEMEYRSVNLQGMYDFDHQVALRNQDYHLNLGVHLLTPLKLEGSDRVVIVDRGWIPQEYYLNGDWSLFDHQDTDTFQGVVRRYQSEPDFGRSTDPIPNPGDPPLKSWQMANIPAIARQIPYPIVEEIYIQLIPEEGALPSADPLATTLPLPSDVDVDLTEGNHQSYALQWFTFATILAVGYPIYVLRTEQKRR